jgi:hypothetical protein
MNPLVIVDQFYRAAEENAHAANKHIVKDHARLRAMLARLKYQRERFEKFLQVQTHGVTFYIIEKMPSELRVSNLPISYHYYDPVPIMMAKYIGA